MNLNFAERIFDLNKTLAVLLDKLHLFIFEHLVCIRLFVDLLLLPSVLLFKSRDSLMELKFIDLLLKLMLFCLA